MTDPHSNGASTAGQSSARLLEGRRLRGCNIHYSSTVFSQTVELGDLSDLRSVDLGATFGGLFLDRFANLPSFSPLGCLPESTVEAIRGEAGLTLPEMLVEAILAVERMIAFTMRRLDIPDFSRVVRAEAAPGVVHLVWECHSAAMSRAAARVAFAGLVELLPSDLVSVPEEGPSFARLLSKLRRRARRRRWGPNIAVLALAAKRRDLPFELLAGNYLRLGEGSLQQVVSESGLGHAAHEPDDTSVSAGISRADKAEWLRHHVLVVGGRVVSALRIDPPRVVGDGTSTLAELIEELNDDPRRHHIGLSRIVVDERARSELLEAGWNLEAVPPSGEIVPMPYSGGWVRDGIASDATDRLDPETRERALRVARDRRLDIASVLFSSPGSGNTGDGLSLEVSPRPELFPHALPGRTQSEQVGRAALDLIFPSDQAARIPAALVVGERGTGSISRGLDRLLRSRGRETVGLTTRDRTTIQGQPVDPTLLSRGGGPEFLLRDPRVSALIGTVSARRIVARGLLLERATVTALLNPIAEGRRESYRAAVDVILAATSGAVVMSPDNPVADAIFDRLEPGRVILVHRDARHPIAKRHLAAGGLVVSPSEGTENRVIEFRHSADLVATVSTSALLGPGRSLNARRFERTLFVAALGFGLDATRDSGRDHETKKGWHERSGFLV